MHRPFDIIGSSYECTLRSLLFAGIKFSEDLVNLKKSIKFNPQTIVQHVTSHTMYVCINWSESQRSAKVVSCIRGESET